MNTSDDLARATKRNHLRISFWPKTRITADDGLEQRDAEQHRELLRRLRQRRNDHQQRHHREILKEQDAEDFAAVRGLELHPLGQQLGQDGGRGHREDAAKGDADLPVDAGEHDQPGDQQHADRDLQQAETEDDALHRVELGQRELETDREHQEDDAELGEMFDAMHVVHQVQGVRADDAADQQVAKDRRQVEAAAEDHRQHRSAKKEKGKGERAQVRYAKSGILGG
jgi:hypothetical protein